MASQRFGKYVVSEILGSGGMAEVYAAVHPDLERKVAIKVILPHFATESNFEERFRREARLVASLRHANIVQIYDFDVVDGRYFMVMEYLQGGTLKDYLVRLKRQKRLMPLDEIVKFVQAIASALDYAHGRGAIHRDIKPANILFTAEDKTRDHAASELAVNGREPVLTDFGIAKLLEDAARLTATGGVLGSPFYMAPEQASGGEVDARGDQYALGVMLFEMATGRLPFLGTSAVAVMTQHCNSAPPSPTSLNAALPEAVEMVLLKALAKRAADRFAAAGELAQALSQAVGSQAVASRPVASQAVSSKAASSKAAESKAAPKQPAMADDATLIVADDDQTEDKTDDQTIASRASDSATTASATTASAPTASAANLPETATLPSVQSSGDEPTLVGDGPNVPMVADEDKSLGEATLITPEDAPLPVLSGDDDSAPAAIVLRDADMPIDADEPLDTDVSQLPARPTPSALQPASEREETRDDIRLPPMPPATPPDLTLPKPTTQHFNVGSVQAGIVNHGGEQTFSGDLSFNLNFGEVKPAPSQPAPSQPAAASATTPGSGDGAELDRLLEGLRRSLGESGRVDRFVRLVNQFQAQLDALPNERASERKQVVKRVHALLLEMTEAKPDPDMVEIMGTSLQRAVQPLAVVDPDLPTLVTRITSWVELIVQPE